MDGSVERPFWTNYDKYTVGANERTGLHIQANSTLPAVRAINFLGRGKSCLVLDFRGCQES